MKITETIIARSGSTDLMLKNFLNLFISWDRTFIYCRYLVQKGGKIDLHSNNGQGPRPIHWASRYCRNKNISLWTKNYQNHKVLIYTEAYSACPLVGIWTPPTPLHLASVPLSPEPKGGGHTRLRVGGGKVPIPTTGEKA